MPNLSDVQLEQVCRAVCKARNLNPDEVMEQNYTFMGGEIQWELLKDEVLARHAALQIDKAIQFVLE